MTTSIDEPVCSAKACRRTGIHAVVWRNPKLHTEDRRKVWLACDEHREHLSGFLQVRGFLLEVVSTAELPSSGTGEA